MTGNVTGFVLRGLRAAVATRIAPRSGSPGDAATPSAGGSCDSAAVRRACARSSDMQGMRQGLRQGLRR
ncbi:MAG: hypothetical protein AW12_00389 [Candidatus Accumulibacter sp. BA-94]|nr:MAG: hypothetical protein AW12_00389 [Candidatus Accumulibacter sp. BA-94]